MRVPPRRFARTPDLEGDPPPLGQNASKKQIHRFLPKVNASLKIRVAFKVRGCRPLPQSTAPTRPTTEESCEAPPGAAHPHSPFCVSFVEHTRVETWKESLLMVQLPRLCRPLPVAAWPFSSSSAFVDGRLRYAAASSSFFASACGFNCATCRPRVTVTRPGMLSQPCL